MHKATIIGLQTQTTTYFFHTTSIALLNLYYCRNAYNYHIAKVAAVNDRDTE